MGERTCSISRRAFMGGAAAFGALTVINPTLAFGESSADAQAQADAVRSQVVNAQAQLEAASNTYYGALQDHDDAVARMDQAQSKIDDANAQISTLQTKLGNRARSMYRSGSSTFIDTLLGATTFEQFATNWDLLNTLNEQDAAMVQQTKDLRDEVESEKAVYAEQEQVAEQKQEEAAAAKANAESTLSTLQSTLSGLDAEAQALLEQEQAAAAVQASQQAVANNGGNSGGGDGGNSGGGSSNDNGAGIPTNGSVVDYALSRIGCPYVWGAEGPNEFDCSGLTRWCYLQVGISIPHQTESQLACASAVMPVSAAAPGDILYRYGHVGIAQVSGGTTYIHAPTFGACVRNTDALSWSGFTAALRI